MRVKAVVFDAYGTLIRNEGLRGIPQRIVADHGLSARADDLYDAWVARYSDAIQRPPFRTLREIECEILGQMLRDLGLDADAMPYVDLFFEATTKVELYPEVPEVLRMARYHSASGSGRPASASMGSGAGGGTPRRSASTYNWRRCWPACHVVRSSRSSAAWGP